MDGIEPGHSNGWSSWLQNSSLKKTKVRLKKLVQEDGSSKNSSRKAMTQNCSTLPVQDTDVYGWKPMEESSQYELISCPQCNTVLTINALYMHVQRCHRIPSGLSQNLLPGSRPLKPEHPDTTPYQHLTQNPLKSQAFSPINVHIKRELLNQNLPVSPFSLNLFNSTPSPVNPPPLIRSISRSKEFDPLIHCGVIINEPTNLKRHNQPCRRSLLCRHHSLPEKRLVPRTKLFDELLKKLKDSRKLAHQQKNTPELTDTTPDLDHKPPFLQTTSATPSPPPKIIHSACPQFDGIRKVTPKKFSRRSPLSQDLRQKVKTLHSQVGPSGHALSLSLFKQSSKSHSTIGLKQPNLQFTEDYSSNASETDSYSFQNSSCSSDLSSNFSSSESEGEEEDTSMMEFMDHHPVPLVLASEIETDIQRRFFDNRRINREYGQIADNLCEIVVQLNQASVKKPSTTMNSVQPANVYGTMKNVLETQVDIETPPNTPSPRVEVKDDKGFQESLTAGTSMETIEGEMGSLEQLHQEMAQHLLNKKQMMQLPSVAEPNWPLGNPSSSNEQVGTYGDEEKVIWGRNNNITPEGVGEAPHRKNRRKSKNPVRLPIKVQAIRNVNETSTPST